MQNDKNYVRGRVLLTSVMDFVLAAMTLIVLSPLLVLVVVVIKVDTSGRLSVDESKLTTALGGDADRVKELLSGSHGLATRAMNQSNLALNNTANLVPFPKISQNAYNTITQSMLFNIFA